MAGQGGRPRRERGVLSLAAIPPDVLVLETSAVIEALMTDRPHHAAYADYVARCVEQGTTFAYSDLLELELAQACVNITLRRLHAGRWFSHRRDGRALRPARKLTDQALAAWFELLAQVESVHVPIGPVGTSSPSVTLTMRSSARRSAIEPLR